MGGQCFCDFQISRPHPKGDCQTLRGSWRRVVSSLLRGGLAHRRRLCNSIHCALNSDGSQFTTRRQSRQARLNDALAFSPRLDELVGILCFCSSLSVISIKKYSRGGIKALAWRRDGLWRKPNRELDLVRPDEPTKAHAIPFAPPHSQGHKGV